MNRRFLVGCLGLVGLGAAVALILLYVNVLRPTREIMGDLKQLGALVELNEQVVERGPFTPPADGELGEQQLERFAAVQTSMRLALGSDFAELRRRAEKMRDMQRNEDGSIVRPGFRDVIDSFKGLGPLLARAKTAQVDALNAEGFSYPEYRWVRETTYAALDKDNADVYLEEFARRVLGMGDAGADTAAGTTGRDGAGDDTAGSAAARPDGNDPGTRRPGTVEAGAEPPVEGITPIEVSAAPRNRILAAAYADSLPLWEPFLVFGL